MTLDQNIPTKPAVVDQPEPGFFKLRLHPNGWHEVPCCIIHIDGVWYAEIDGEQKTGSDDPIHAPGVLDVWHKRKIEIDHLEYEFLTTRLKEWARQFYPDHPLLDPKARVVASNLRPIPRYTAPKPGVPQSPEPLPENRPQPAKPISSIEIEAWLAYEHENLASSIVSDIAQLADDAEPIESAEELSRVSANVDIANAHRRQAESARKLAKEPFVDGGRSVDGWFKRWTDPLGAAIGPVQAQMNAYGTRIEAEKRREAEQKAREARELADQRAREAQRALEREQQSNTTPPPGTGAVTLLTAAAEASRKADKAESIATGSAANLTRGYGSYGGVVSGQENWGWEVTDLALVPLELLQVIEIEVNKRVRVWAKENPTLARAGQSPIPGIKVIRTVSMRNR
jgi:hypothetical protein